MSEEAKVKRYSPILEQLSTRSDGLRASMVLSQDGEYVPFPDFDALERQLEQLAITLNAAVSQRQAFKDELDEARASERRMREAIEAHNKRCDELVSWESHTRPQHMRIDLPPTDPRNDEVQP